MKDLEGAPVPPPLDQMDMNRHVWRKGRMEFLGGRTCYTQGHGIPGYENNNRVTGYGYFGRDRYATEELGVDIEEY